MSEQTDDYWAELGRRAVACAGWRWMPGMLDQYGQRVVSTCWLPPDPGVPGMTVINRNSRPVEVRCRKHLPDLRDPATLGCLLALVREALGDPRVCAVATIGEEGWWDAGWESASWDVPAVIRDTEAEALVCALEAAGD